MPGKKKELSFEESMSRLECIVSELEKGDAPLEETLALFEEGMKLMRRCSTALDRAEQQVSMLFPGADGEPVEERVSFPGEGEL